MLQKIHLDKITKYVGDFLNVPKKADPLDI